MTWSRRRRAAGVAGGAAVALALLVGAPNVWVRQASGDRQYDVDSAPPRDVALVLGAGVRADGQPTPYLAARLDIARRLYERGAIKVVLVSGDNRTETYNEPKAMAEYLVARGIPGEKIVADYAGLDTYDSCYRAKHVFGVEQVTVVSQSYHVPRALAICRAIGLDAIAVGDDTGRASAQTWAAGEQREIAANVKAAWDVLSRREPMLGPPEPGVRDALRR